MGVNSENARATIVEQFGAGDTEPEGKLEYAEEAHAALETALREALGFRHELVGTEHLLLGLLRRSDSRAVTVLHHLRVDPNSVRERVLDLIGAPGFVSPERPQHAASASGIVSTGSGPVTARNRGDGIDIRALADEVTMLRAEIAELRATVHRLERGR
jgi:ATP-dependent Clp protease ATP-binding subunit ClpC